jgi:hypothetical protein
MWKCPKCNSTCLNVSVVASAKLIQEEDGNFQTEIDGDHEWDDASLMWCDACGHSAETLSFTQEEEQ